MAEDWITTAEAAGLIGYHPDYIPRLIKSGKVRGRRFGNAWQIDRASLLAFSREIKQKGQKRGPKAKT